MGAQTEHSVIQTVRVGGEQGDYLLVQVAASELSLVRFAVQSKLTREEEALKQAQEWSFASLAFLFVSFFSVFLFCVTQKNTKAASMRERGDFNPRLKRK